MSTSLKNNGKKKDIFTDEWCKNSHPADLHWEKQWKSRPRLTGNVELAGGTNHTGSATLGWSISPWPSCHHFAIPMTSPSLPRCHIQGTPPHSSSMGTPDLEGDSGAQWGRKVLSGCVYLRLWGRTVRGCAHGESVTRLCRHRPGRPGVIQCRGQSCRTGNVLSPQGPTPWQTASAGCCEASPPGLPCRLP